MNSQKTCLVAGGAGFIGSNLCDSLLLKGYRVIAADNLITGLEKNLEDARKNPVFSFVKVDISQKSDLALPKIDYIFHLASPASVPDYQKYPMETALANSAGTVNLLNLARRNGAKFLFASTSEIYGNPLEHPQKESYWGNVNPVGIRSCYDESKRFGETLTMISNRQFGTDIRIIRIFNTYGPRMRPTDGRVVSNFINQAISGNPVTVYGKGLQTRSFCYVSDMVSGIAKAMFTENSKGEIFNLGNPEEKTVNDLANLVIKLSGSPAGIVYKDLPDDDPERRRPDISKSGKILGWEPQVNLDAGITKTIAYYRKLDQKS
jgi:dTDP-glucose 4,6-dehydratase/UDP-glucuronate decarboxylase